MGAKAKRQQQLNRDRQRRFRERQKAAQAERDQFLELTDDVTDTVTHDVAPEVAEVLARFAWLFDKYKVPAHEALDKLLALTAMLVSDSPQVKMKAFYEIGVGFGIIAPQQPAAPPEGTEPASNSESDLSLSEEPPPMLTTSPPTNPVLDILMRH